MIGCLATLERTAQFAMIVKVGMQKYRLNQRTQLVVILALDQIQINHVVKYLTEALVGCNCGGGGGGASTGGGGNTGINPPSLPA